MNRVLVTGGAGAIGAAVVRRLLRDPDFEVRVSDQRDIPGWMREGGEVHRGDLRDPAEARKAIGGCSHVVHLASFTGEGGPHTRLEFDNALHAAVVRAALDAAVTRFVLVSSEAVHECAGREAEDLPAEGFSQLTGEVYCRAAHEEHGLPFTICRPIGVYGPGVPGLVADLLGGERRLPAAAGTPWIATHVSDAADGIVAAMASPAGLDEDFDLAAEPVELGEIARLRVEAAGGDPRELRDGDGHGVVASGEKARQLLGWRPQVALPDGIARLAA